MESRPREDLKRQIFLGTQAFIETHAKDGDLIAARRSECANELDVKSVPGLW